jgi:calcium permeable stress-gated cation channel
LAVHFRGLFRYAPLQLESEALLRDRKEEVARSSAEQATTVQTVPSPRSEKGTEAPRMMHERPSQIERAEQSPRPAFLTEQQRSSQSLTATHMSRRGTEMEAQKQHDTHQANHILARLNRPLDEARLAELESNLARAEAYIGSTFLPRRRDIVELMNNDPISKIIMQHNDDLEALTAEERDMLVSVAFTHPILRETRPAVWIPKDDAGVSDDEVRRTREYSQDITIENRGAFFNKKLKVEVDRPPPDMSEFALVMGVLWRKF